MPKKRVKPLRGHVKPEQYWGQNEFFYTLNNGGKVSPRRARAQDAHDKWMDEQFNKIRDRRLREGSHKHKQTSG